MTEIPIQGDLQSQCASSEPFALQVLGDSMEPEFPDKCIIVIAPGDEAVNGAYVFVEVEGVRWFRQYCADPSGIERLTAVNPLYPDIILQDVDWQILGHITQRNVRRKIKHYKYV